MTEGTQRRLAAIVSADVVGYSRLMGVDETGTLATLRAHRADLIDPLIAEHGGRIVKTLCRSGRNRAILGFDRDPMPRVRLRLLRDRHGK